MGITQLLVRFIYHSMLQAWELTSFWSGSFITVIYRHGNSPGFGQVRLAQCFTGMGIILPEWPVIRRLLWNWQTWDQTPLSLGFFVVVVVVCFFFWFLSRRGGDGGGSHTSDLKIGTTMATLPGALCYVISGRSGWPGVSILWLGEIGLICNVRLSVAPRTIVQVEPFPRYTSMSRGC